MGDISFIAMGGMKRSFIIAVELFFIVGGLFALDVVETANKDFLTIEETLVLAEKDSEKNIQLINSLKFLQKISEGQVTADPEEINSVIDQCPYMPCTEAFKIMISSNENILDSANYIYSVFTSCPKNNSLKDQVYLKILEASVKENNFSWSYNAARDLSETAKENSVYKSFKSALTQN